MILNKKQRRTVRALAHAQWAWRTSDLAMQKNDGKTYSHDRLLDRRKKQMLPDLRMDLEEAFGTGIFASILISLAMKLAMKWIKEWMEDELYGVHIPRAFSEPRK